MTRAEKAGGPARGSRAVRLVTALRRTQGAASLAQAAGVSAESGPIEFRARLVAAGRVRALGGGPGRYVIAAAAIRQAIDEGLFNGLACLVDHADGHPSVRDLLGVWHDVQWDEASQAAVGRLHLFATATTEPVIDLLGQWLVGDERPDLGISLVVYPALESDGETIRELVMIESADVVMFPAVESGRLLAHEPATGAPSLATVPATAGPTGAKKMNKLEDGQMNERVNGKMVASVALSTSGAASPTADWQQALRVATAEAIIGASGLPAVVQTRLRAADYATPQDVEAAVDGARQELAALAAQGLATGAVVRLGNRPPREVQLSDPLDRARDMVGFFFGDTEAAAPPPNMRSFADLYVALTGDVHFRGVFDGTRVAFAGATTSTLPNLAVDAMNKVIVQQFQALDHYRWFERITSVEPNDGSLQDMKWITLGGVGNLPSVNEGAAYTELSVADVTESAAFVKRGGYVGITREMIKNSNIQQLQAIPRALAVAAVRTRSSAVAALFTSNAGVGPTLAQDSKALFHTDHANLLTTALGTDATAWRAARAECFKQTEVGSGKPLGIFPRYVLVPAQLYDTALSVLGYGEGMPTAYVPEAQGRGFADPRPVPLVVPDWTDATDWAYIVDPAVFPVIQMSYSQQPGGRKHPAPELFAVVSDTSGLMFANDILPVKVRDEFALGVNGHRGIGKRNVA